MLYTFHFSSRYCSLLTKKPTRGSFREIMQSANVFRDLSSDYYCILYEPDRRRPPSAPPFKSTRSLSAIDKQAFKEQTRALRQLPSVDQLGAVPRSTLNDQAWVSQRLLRQSNLGTQENHAALAMSMHLNDAVLRAQSPAKQLLYANELTAPHESVCLICVCVCVKMFTFHNVILCCMWRHCFLHLQSLMTTFLLFHPLSLLLPLPLRNVPPHAPLSCNISWHFLYRIYINYLFYPSLLSCLIRCKIYF